MIVLGATNDEKGTQLEMLTQYVLEHLGYQNIVRSWIAPGGAEIDVSAEFVQPAVGGERRHKLICECKAHQSPIDTTAWLKFLGKILMEQTTRNQEISGCFISLSGVNGNVAGSYDSYRRHKQNVTIIDEQDILKQIKQSHTLCSIQTVTDTVRSCTERIVNSLEVAYYERELFWLVQFAGDEYTLIAASGDPLAGNKRTLISPLIEAVTTSRTFIDLFAEAEAQRRTIALQKSILAAFVARDGKLPVTIPESQPNIGIPANLAGFDTSEALNDFNRIMRLIQERGWIEVSQQDQEIRFRLNEVGRCLDITAIFRFVLSGEAPIEVVRDFIGSKFYDRHIDRQLINEIQHIQGDIPLTNEQADELSVVLRLSPSALITLLEPVSLIVQHRLGEQSVDDPEVDKEDAKILFNIAYDRLFHDFRQPVLAGYFYKVRGIREIENIQQVRVKTHEKVMLEGKISHRAAIKLAAVEYGGGFLLVSMLGNAEEPWQGAEPDQQSVDNAYHALYNSLTTPNG